MSDWTPFNGRGWQFDMGVGWDDPWPFKNVRVT